MLFPVLDYMLMAINEQHENTQLESGTDWILQGFNKEQLKNVASFVASFNSRRYSSPLKIETRNE